MLEKRWKPDETMPAPPAQPKIYHITHVDNLPSIISDDCLVSDAAMIARGGPSASIGMSSIKQRRLTLPVDCHPGDHVGDYVPFYFCYRSVMLFLIYRANHPDLTYRGGQGPIVHLEADLYSVVRWANQVGTRLAFSLSNAGAYLHAVPKAPDRSRRGQLASRRSRGFPLGGCERRETG
jgi:hypothetical protein